MMLFLNDGIAKDVSQRGAPIAIREATEVEARNIDKLLGMWADGSTTQPEWK